VGAVLNIQNIYSFQALRLPSGMALIQRLYCRRITEPDQVLDLVIFPTQGDDNLLPVQYAETVIEEGVAYDGRSLRHLATQFKQHLRHYLHGSGHPDLPGYNDWVGAKEREAARQDVGFRARQFVSLMTGSSFLDFPARKMEARFKTFFRIVTH
jgi:hypothetical protein